GNNDILIADSARMKVQGNTMLMTFFKGQRYEDYTPERGKPENMPHGRTYFDSLVYQFPLQGFDLSRTDEGQFRHQLTLSRRQLRAALDSLKGIQAQYLVKSLRQVGRYTKVDTDFLHYPLDTLSGQTHTLKRAKDEPKVHVADRQDMLNRALVSTRAVKSYVEFMVKKVADQAETSRNYRYVYHRLYALPLNCLIFIFIGASLGAIIRQGGFGVPAIISIVSFLLSYMLNAYGKKLVLGGFIEPWMGAWLPILIYTPVAIFLT
ncbi:MAG: LptF/LptG family permease, partial [Bacteroidota bacterium]